MEKIIHQIWIGPYEMLERDKIFCNKVREMNPDYKYIFWDNNNFPKLPAELERLKNHYYNYSDWVNIAHILRYYIPYMYGGLHIDCDYEFFNSLSELELENKDGFIHLNWCDTDPTICSSFYGVQKNHPMAKFIYEKLANSNGEWLGPNWFGCVVKEYLGLDCRYVLDDKFVSEKLSVLNISHNKSLSELRKLAIHHGSATWLKEVQDKMILDSNYKKQWV